MKKLNLFLILVGFLIILFAVILFFYGGKNSEENDSSKLQNIADNLCNPKTDARLVYRCEDYIQVTPDYESGITGGSDTFYFSDGEKLDCCFTCGPQYLDSRCLKITDENCTKEKIC